MAKVVETKFDYEKVCPNCKKTIAYNMDEVRITEGHYGNTTWYLTCPNCKKEFIIKL